MQGGHTGPPLRNHPDQDNIFLDTPTDIPRPADFPHILVVHASAGAGKTHSLALRFLQLLALAENPTPEVLRSVLALTFTVAAAQEMKSRIVSFLKDIALRTQQGRTLQDQSGLDPVAARNWLDCILAHYHGFQVKTIDSLHFQMVQALGHRMNLWPDLETSFDQARWARLMLRSLLNRTDWDEAGSEDTDVNGTLRSLWEDIFTIYLRLELRGGVRFLDWLETQAAQVFVGLSQVLGPLQTTTIGALNDRQKAFEDACQTFLKALHAHDLEKAVSRFPGLTPLHDPLNCLESAFFAKDAPQQLFKKSVHARADLPLIWPDYVALGQARNAFLLERAKLRVSPLARLRSLLIREMERLGQTQGLLLGGWWTRLIREHLNAEDLLAEAEMVLNAGWRHVLIDEFQDTSREQWEILRELILEALAHGGSLFCVGDVKQAIYGWRGGDWRLFLEPLRGSTFPCVPDHARTQAGLPFNRRSCPDIVDFNNACFGDLADPEKRRGLVLAIARGKDEDDVRASLDQALSRLYCDARQLPWKNCQGQIHTTVLKAETLEEYASTAMQTLVRDVQALRQRKTSLGDMAVLVRTNAEAGECAKALLGQDIPTITEQSLTIAAHPLVRGLLALLAWLDNPDDDAALYAVCKSPLLASTVAAPEALLSCFAGTGQDRGQAPALRLVLQHQEPDAWARFLQPFLEHAGFAGAYEALLAATSRFALRSLPLGEWAWVEKLLEAAWNAEMDGAASLPGFLEYWRRQGHECAAGLPEGLNAVRVLTVHKAKGLEFPRVFMPLLGYGPKNRQDYHLLRATGSEPFLAAAARPRSAEVAAAVAQELVKSLAEELNLLYVALTRATQAMHLYLADIPNARGSRASDWLRALLHHNNEQPCPSSPVSP